MSTIATLAQQEATYAPLVLFDITSIEDAAVLRISTVGCSFNGDVYQALVSGVSGFDLQLDSSPLGIFAVSDIQLTLGNADNSMAAWDNTHYFKNARITATLVLYDMATGKIASSDSLVIFKGICNPPDGVTPTELSLSAFNRFNADLLLLPASKISQFSQTTFPGEGKVGADTANSGDANTACYEWNNADSNRELACWMCGYGPLRGNYGFPGSNPNGNFVVSLTVANIFSSKTIGNSGASWADISGHFVVIASGTGAGQSRQVDSNTATTITTATDWTVVPDATSSFVVLYGFCDHSADSCKARGMYSTDSQSRATGRFRGIDYIPADFKYEQPSGKTTVTQSDIQQAKYNNVIPLVYGTARVHGQALFMQTANDTRGHMLVCEGPIESMSEFIIGGILIPFTYSYQRVDTTTGLWAYTSGQRGFASPLDPEFPNQDPYSLMAVLYFNIPPQFMQGGFDGSIVVKGGLVETFDKNGNSLGYGFSSNPAWVILDLLKRSGWKLNELNLPSFHSFSQYCAQEIDTYISSTETTLFPRFGINLVIDQQQAVADILRSALGMCRGMLSYDSSGSLRIDCENRLANTTLYGAVSASGSAQFATVGDGAGLAAGTSVSVDGGGSLETVEILSVKTTGTDFQIEGVFTKAHSSGAAVVAQPAYAFDLSSTLSENDLPVYKRSSLPLRQTPNEFSIPFQNSLADYVTDTAILMSTYEATAFGAKVTGQLAATGFPTVDAAVRIAQLALYKAQGRRDASNRIQSRGNLFVTIGSSVKAAMVGLGSVVTLTYPDEGFVAKKFRVVGITPTEDSEFPYWQIQLTLREHDDGWYDDINGNITPPPQLPKPPTGGPGGGKGGAPHPPHPAPPPRQKPGMQ